MSKKSVIVPKHKWVTVEYDPYFPDVKFHAFDNRKKARRWARNIGGTVRKVTKIVYYYE